MNRTHGDRINTTDKVYVLKKQVDSAKKEISRLKKELNIALQLLAEANNMLLDKKSSKVKKAEMEEALTCDQCGKGSYLVTKFQLRNSETKTYLQCPLCDHRKAEK